MTDLFLVASDTFSCTRPDIFHRTPTDMACPLTDPLEKLLAALEAEGYEPCFDEIDARAARDAICSCTNCGARGRFGYVGVKRDGIYRAFWSCEACRHWIEV